LTYRMGGMARLPPPLDPPINVGLLLRACTFANSSHKARNDFIRTIHHTMHDNVYHMPPPPPASAAAAVTSQVMSAVSRQQQQRHDREPSASSSAAAFASGELLAGFFVISTVITLGNVCKPGGRRELKSSWENLAVKVDNFRV